MRDLQAAPTDPQWELVTTSVIVSYNVVVSDHQHESVRVTTTQMNCLRCCESHRSGARYNKLADTTKMDKRQQSKLRLVLWLLISSLRTFRVYQSRLC